LIERARKELPIRFEIHSHSHNQREPDSAAELDAAVEAYDRFFGRTPKGYRAPNGLISREGLRRLAERGFHYDSSIFPSFRFDEYGYNNLSSPLIPYRFKLPEELIELPLGVIRKVRLVISLSYIKLLGLPFYKMLISLFDIPSPLVILCHPYDFSIDHQLHKIGGWKRYAHARNSARAEELFIAFIRYLKSKGYRFVFVDEVLDRLDARALPVRNFAE
jgi:peptidoglycan/xylan/chitin deacetylase (PgdA/CDA1 family)